ncbi:GH25 family lysozyme [Paenibacillus polymyxa]|nr:GH25 family lysozyme [Paenibacillus polymyxa]
MVWKAVKASGISFAFLKASQGKSYRDKTFIGNHRLHELSES